MAKNPGRLTDLLSAALVAVALPGSATPQGPGVVPVRPAASPPVIDGSIGADEWREATRLEMNRREQVWMEAERGTWGGVGDLSAEFWLTYDPAHLYLAGIVRDNSLVPQPVPARWESADAIELFLNLDLGDDQVEGASGRFNDDDVQIFFMALNEARPWGQIEWDPKIRRRALRSGSAWTGVEVAYQSLGADRYGFEARLPFHNLLPVRGLPIPRRIGFALAVDDHDEGTDRYQYVTLDGRNPVDDTRNFLTLQFTGPLPLEPTPAAGGRWVARLLRVLPYVVVPLLAVVAVALLLRAWGALSARRRRLRATGRVLALVLFVSGLFLADVVSALRGRAYDRDLGRIVAALGDGIPAMERGTLASYAGAERGTQLVELLRGRSVERRRYYDYVRLVDLVPQGFGPTAVRYPGEFWDVLPYWVPLPPGEPERFDFSPPLDGRRLLVVLATAKGSTTVPELRFEVDDGQVTQVRFDGLRAPASPLGVERKELMYELVDLPAQARSLVVTGMRGDELEIVGLTLLVDERASGEPLHLGRPSLGGIETELRGPYPVDAGVELASGETRIELPGGDAAGFDRLWIVHTASGPGVLIGQLPPNTEVGGIEVQFRDDGAPLVVPLQHQRNVLFELSRNNQVVAPPPGSGAAIAYQWTGRDRELHLNVVSEIELPRGRPVAAVVFRSEGVYPLRFRSVVFGRERDAAPTDPASSPLMRVDPGTVRLRPEFAARLRGAAFAIYRAGRRSGAAEEAPGAPAVLPFGGAPAAGEVRRVDVQDGSRVHAAYLGMEGAGWFDTVLGVFVTDLGYARFAVLVHRVGIGLCILASPVLLLLLAEAMAALQSLRFRLVAVLSVATVVPLGVLAWTVVNVVEDGHRDRQATSLVRAAEVAGQLLSSFQRNLAESADAWLRTHVEELRTGGDIDVLRARLADRLASQRPPDWKGGFMRLDFVPAPAASAPPPFTVYDGDSQLRRHDTALRLEPGVYLLWGQPVVGIRREVQADQGTLSLSVAAPLNASVLGRLAGSSALQLFDVRGYPLATATDDAAVRDSAVRPELMTARRRLVADAAGESRPLFKSHDLGDRELLGAYTVLRDAEQTPRFVLGLLGWAQPAVLPLSIGAVPVRGFFVALAGFVLLLSVFLSFVVTNRISGPIERLERGAQALGRGELDVRVPAEAADGQIGRLTRSFNQMAQDLRSRIEDLRVINLGMQELTSKLDLRQALDATAALFMRHSPADRVRLVLPVEDADDPADDPVDAAARAALGPFSARLAPAATGGPAAAGLPRSAVGLPLTIAGRNRGCVLLLFGLPTPPPLNLELLATLAVQAAAALENARLYLRAVEDPYTGAFVAEHFRRQVGSEIARAQEAGDSVVVISARLADADRLREQLGQDRLELAMERLATGIRASLKPPVVLGRFGSGELRVLRSGAAAAVAADVAAVNDGVARVELELPSPRPPCQVEAATFPAEAVSAEFLFSVLEARLEAARHLLPGDEPVPLIRPDSELVATSGAMQHVLRTLARVAPTDLPLLIEGETGTGKELLADLAHRWSPRSRGPLVKVHCAALPESLLQSELFGHEKGAFTGADRAKPGRFELAHGGSLVLDEIGEISLDVQVQLLRVLQEKEVDRVGGLEPVPVDVRIIASTNRNLREMVAAGRFREDLYYRLQGVTLQVPPLRDRRDEIPALVERFLDGVRAAGQTEVVEFAADAMDALFRHDWPGNVRELRNAIVRAAILAGGERVDGRHLAGVLGGGDSPPLPAAGLAAGAAMGAGSAPASGAVPAAATPAPVGATEGRLGRLLELIGERGEVSVSDCASHAGTSPRTALRDLQELMRRGLVIRAGSRRGARYLLARNGE